MTDQKTPRQQLKTILPNGEFTVEQLANLVDQSVKRILDDLDHVRQSEGDLFQMIPPRCRGCGFEFSERKRLDRPSSCPECNEERVDGPWFSLQVSRTSS